MQDEAWNSHADAALPGQPDAFGALLQARAQGSAHVVAQLGLSLDGRIATETGDSRYINGSDALRHLHRLRALVDAVVVGAGTVRADDPQLSVRLCPGRSPARVVIDPNGTIPASARVWAADGARRLVFGGAPDLPEGVERLPAAGEIPVGAIRDRLAKAGLRRLLVEGGADTLSRFLAAGAVDSLHLLYGRVIIGSGKIGINLPAMGALANAPRPATRTAIFPDGDLLVACDFRACESAQPGRA